MVRAARKARGLSSDEVAAIAGVSPAAIRQLEAGRVDRPFPETLQRISSALGIPMQDLAAAAMGIEPPSSQSIDEITRERVEAEVLRIADIPGTQEKIDALKLLSPSLYPLVRRMVFDILRESDELRTQPEQQQQDSQILDCL